MCSGYPWLSTGTLGIPAQVGVRVVGCGEGGTGYHPASEVLRLGIRGGGYQMGGANAQHTRACFEATTPGGGAPRGCRGKS